MTVNQGHIKSHKYRLVKLLAEPDKYGASHVFATLKRLELEESLRFC